MSKDLLKTLKEMREKFLTEIQTVFEMAESTAAGDQFIIATGDQTIQSAVVTAEASDNPSTLDPLLSATLTPQSTRVTSESLIQQSEI